MRKFLKLVLRTSVSAFRLGQKEKGQVLGTRGWNSLVRTTLSEKSGSLAIRVTYPFALCVLLFCSVGLQEL